MAKPLQLQIIETARALIADEQHWCRRHLALDETGIGVFPTSESAAKRCALGAVAVGADRHGASRTLGAVIAAAYRLTHDYDAANELAYSALYPRYSTATLVHVNDMRGHAAVLALFDEVIAGM